MPRGGSKGKKFGGRKGGLRKALPRVAEKKGEKDDRRNHPGNLRRKARLIGGHIQNTKSGKKFAPKQNKLLRATKFWEKKKKKNIHSLLED